MDLEFYIMLAAMIVTMGYCIHAVDRNTQMTIAWGESVVRALEANAARDDEPAALSPAQTKET